MAQLFVNHALAAASCVLNRLTHMTTKQTNNIGKLLTEIALAITPIVLEEGRRWLERRRHTGNATPRKRNPKPKAA